MTTLEATGSVDARRAIIGWLLRAALAIPFIGAIMFFAAGTLDWLSGWLYLGWYLFVSVLSVFITDPALLAERSNSRRVKGQKGWDKVIIGVYGLLAPLVTPLVAGLDIRFGWQPEVVLWVQILAWAIYAVGWGIHLWAMSANRYFSTVVRLQTERKQTVVTHGPYRVVRHPGYVGGILTAGATGLVLGSVWALVVGLVAALLLVVRTALEDAMLQRELEGYQEYTHRTRYRLLPGVW